MKSVIGLTYSNDKPEEVILSFTPLQGKYIQALPLHRSQQIIKETKEGVVIKLKVIPNFELQQKILMFGDSIKVLQPEWLSKEIKSVLVNTLNQYKK